MTDLKTHTPIAGFTLVEVIIAISILAVAMIGVNMAWYNNTNSLRKSQSYNEASFLLQKKITEMEIRFKDTPLENIDEELTGDFGKDHPLFRWTFESKDMDMPDLRPLFMATQGDDGVDENLLTVLSQMKKFFDTSIKEARVTVYQKVRDKEKKYSVTWYFVNYDQPFNLLGGG